MGIVNIITAPTEAVVVALPVMVLVGGMPVVVNSLSVLLFLSSA